MSNKNRLNRSLERLDQLPRQLRPLVLSFLFGRAVPFVRTAGVRFIELGEDRAVLAIPSRRKVQNHIGTVHASAMGLLAETATGAVLAMNVPDERIQVLKSMRVNYLKRAQGMLHAEASLSMQDRYHIVNEEKGELLVPVHVKDESGEAPLECEMLWAWRPKRNS